MLVAVVVVLVLHGVEFSPNSGILVASGELERPSEPTNLGDLSLATADLTCGNPSLFLTGACNAITVHWTRWPVQWEELRTKLKFCLL